MMQFYGVTEQDVPRHRLPQLVLDVERTELGIQAGLQDRVVQVRGKRRMGEIGYAAGAAWVDFVAAVCGEVAEEYRGIRAGCDCTTLEWFAYL